MSKTETVFYMDNQEENDEKLPSTSTKQLKDTKIINEDWVNSRIPPKLDKNEVCTLFEYFLGNINDKDRKKYINVFRKQKLTGKTLVKACENEILLEKLEKILNLPVGYKVGFYEMKDFIKRRQSELYGENNENGECSEAPQKSDCKLTRKRKLSSSDEPNEAIGAEVRHDKKSKGVYKKVNVKKETTTNGKLTGLKVDATDTSEIEVDEINVTDERSSPAVKEES